MDLISLTENLKNCPCGQKHTFDTKVCEIASGLVHKTGQILSEAQFPKKILLVADDNTLAASEGILESLAASGFELKKLIYSNLNYARAETVNELIALSHDVGGILSVGSGSLNDICRAASNRAGIEFAIFATAPSMDGFASDTAPIIENNFKISWQCRQPGVIIADTKILAAAPAELKSAGFGDMIAKYVAIVDWKIAALTIDEYYCESIVGLVKEAIARIVALADGVTGNDEKAAGEVMEALVFTGLAMKLAKSSRPASGCEHVISHFWECKKLVRGVWPEYHGKKVGVATVQACRLYRKIAAENETINPTRDTTDWDEVKAAYGPELIDDMMKCNRPSITDRVDPALLKAKWSEIRKIILEELPDEDKLLSLMKRAGAATEPSEVNVDRKLYAEGMKYHPYMRNRLLLTRLIPMLGIKYPEI